MLRRKHLSLSLAIEAYLLALKMEGRSKTTLYCYGYILRRLARHFQGQPVTRIKPNEAAAYLVHLAGTGIAPSTLSVYTVVLKRFFSWAVEQGHIKVSPVAGMRTHTQPWKPVAPFSEEEIRRLLQAVKTPMEKALLLLLLDTGLRASELSGLRLEDINLKTGEISVTGKGQKARKVALNPGPRKALLDYFSSQAQLNGLLWPEGWHRRRLTALLDRLGRRAKVSRVFPHRFRHTFATRFLADSGDALALKALLGHSSLMMVTRYIQAAEGARAVTVHKRHSLVT